MYANSIDGSVLLFVFSTSYSCFITTAPEGSKANIFSVWEKQVLKF